MTFNCERLERQKYSYERLINEQSDLMKSLNIKIRDCIGKILSVFSSE